MTYTHRNPTVLTYHLMNSRSSYLSLTETYRLQKYYLLDFCNADQLQRCSGNLCLQNLIIKLYLTFWICSENPIPDYGFPFQT